MQIYTVKKDYIKTSPNPMDDIVANIMRDIPEDLRIAMRVGCQIETTFLHEPDGIKILVRTKNPISILKSPDGHIIDVYEKK